MGATRGDRQIDRLSTTFGTRLESCGTVSPLETDATDECPSVASDHRVTYARADLKRMETFEWLTYSYVYYNEDSVAKFKT